MIYHCRNYTEIKGDPLFDPNRHARVGVVKWTAEGPDFGVPEPDSLWTPTTTDVLPADGGALAGNSGSELTCVIVRNVAIPTKTNN